MIGDLFNRGSLPVLEKLVDFTSQRHRVLAHNIANLSTPNLQQRDLDVNAFQASLQSALEKRRAAAERVARAAETGERISPSDPLAPLRRLDVKLSENAPGILYHDRNNRDLERTMASLAENTMAHNMALELIRSEVATLRMAIRERLV